jgi:hypothetical protein
MDMQNILCQSEIQSSLQQKFYLCWLVLKNSQQKNMLKSNNREMLIN